MLQSQNGVHTTVNSKGTTYSRVITVGYTRPVSFGPLPPLFITVTDRYLPSVLQANGYEHYEVSNYAKSGTPLQKTRLSAIGT